jgi:hypothetical protein
VPQLRAVGALGCAAQADHDVQRGQVMLVMTETLSNQAAHPVTFHRAAQHAGGDRQTQARRSAGVGQHHSREAAGRQTPALRIQPPEIRSVPHSALGR